MRAIGRTNSMDVLGKTAKDTATVDSSPRGVPVSF
jgi:hypothetical protein